MPEVGGTKCVSSDTGVPVGVISVVVFEKPESAAPSWTPETEF